jgi:hypothetical protein
LRRLAWQGEVQQKATGRTPKHRSGRQLEKSVQTTFESGLPEALGNKKRHPKMAFSVVETPVAA